MFPLNGVFHKTLVPTNSRELRGWLPIENGSYTLLFDFLAGWDPPSPLSNRNTPFSFGANWPRPVTPSTQRKCFHDNTAIDLYMKRLKNHFMKVSKPFSCAVSFFYVTVFPLQYLGFCTTLGVMETQRVSTPVRCGSGHRVLILAYKVEEIFARSERLSRGKKGIGSEGVNKCCCRYFLVVQRKQEFKAGWC